MYNRGSEAVIRSVVWICRFWYPDSHIVVVTGQYGETAKNILEADVIVPKFDVTGGVSYLLHEAEDADVVLITGADNYDYGYGNTQMKEIHDKLFAQTNKRTVLFDMSLRHDHWNKEIWEDISRFDVITVRETETLHLFEQHFSKDKIRIYPDPAFVLPMTKCALPYGFESDNMIGVNISTMITDGSFGADKETIIREYKSVIDFILHNTVHKIILIPHVVNNGLDSIVIDKLYENYRDVNRVSVLHTETTDCMQIKYIISKLRFLITARTHASIAAYSTNVPTLVVSYSIKSVGIAKDIFGKGYEKMIISVNELNKAGELTNKFQFFLNNESEIKDVLRKRMKTYRMESLMFGEALEI